MITMRGWSLLSYNEPDEPLYKVEGIIFGHDRIMDGISAHTSNIEEVSLDNDRINVLTHSKNNYVLELSEIDMSSFDITEMILDRFGVSINKDYCQQLKNKKSADLIKFVDSVIDDNELFLEMAGVYVQNAFFKKDGNIRGIKFNVHLGMFKDSYLVSDYDKGWVDFRYFGDLNYIKPYHWSDGLDAIKIKNVGSLPLRFRGTNTCIECNKDEITKVDHSMYTEDELLSPDAVNDVNFFKNTISANDLDFELSQKEIDELLNGGDE